MPLIMKKFLCFLLLLLLVMPADAAPKNKKWNSYVNARFNYSIEYPNIFTKRTESENGDGLWLEAKDTRLTLSGGYNVLMQDGADMVGSRNLEGMIIGESGSGWFRLVRREGTMIIHEYGVLNDDVWASFTFTYIKTKNFNSVIKKMEKTLRLTSDSE